MKRLLSLALIIAMMFMMSANVYAETITNDGINSGNVTVTYNSSVTYTVTIPDSMTIGETATISISNVVIGSDQALNVTVSSSQYNNGWQLTDGKTNVGYTLKANSSYEDLTNNGCILYTTAGQNASITLNTAIKETPIYSGTFTDTLTFSVNFVEKNITRSEAEALVEQCAALCKTIENDSSLSNQFSSDRMFLATKKDTFNTNMKNYFNGESTYTQEQINSDYKNLLAIYNELAAKVSATS